MVLVVRCSEWRVIKTAKLISGKRQTENNEKEITRPGFSQRERERERERERNWCKLSPDFLNVELGFLHGVIKAPLLAFGGGRDLLGQHEHLGGGHPGPTIHHTCGY